jgi:hypothetical protein
MKNIYWLIFMLLSFGFATAQNSSVNILKRTVNKMQSLKSISYEQGFTNVNPFSQATPLLA